MVCSTFAGLFVFIQNRICLLKRAETLKCIEPEQLELLRMTWSWLDLEMVSTLAFRGLDMANMINNQIDLLTIPGQALALAQLSKPVPDRPPPRLAT